ncbi:uncharacterized protein LOC123292660 [Chrysoperla carnea]|uniref:uncharacterized protein LOC123292660 n=1 Tax=Chrysoperla carnea TaxID=189513 RepID=UPI001D080BF8|nr:uncharacterized protein LOC123292660 [Chrysoperla carnea]
MLINLLLTLISLSYLSWREVLSLRLLEIRIPTHAVRNNVAILECNFDLDGEELYSVKWYKDGNEFYRYVPKNDPPGQKFPLSGIYVDEQKSTEKMLAISPVTLQSSGVYRCEVSAEAPSFQTVQDEGNMTVVALPDSGPKITGAFARYKIGEKLAMKCISGKSKPATDLTWLLNGEQVHSQHLRGPFRVVVGSEGLEQTSLTLHFKVKASHFKGSEMKLECLATINPVYSQSSTEIVGNIPRTHRKHHNNYVRTTTPMFDDSTTELFSQNLTDDSLNATTSTSCATNFLYAGNNNILLTIFFASIIKLVFYLIVEQFSR